MQNPLKHAILQILNNTSSPLKEYDLHRILGNAAFEEFTQNCSQNVILFRKHFLVMNALYQLSDELQSLSLKLHISALKIYLSPIHDNKHKNNSSHLAITNNAFYKLSLYYCNWDNFYQTDSNDVQQLLSQFWQNYLHQDQQQQSLDSLQLSTNATWIEIKDQYRQLCQQHHPDKGGDPIYFLEIRSAYDNLKIIHKISS